MLFVISFRCISKHKCLYAHVGDRSKHDFVETITCFNSSGGPHHRLFQAVCCAGLTEPGISLV